MLLATGMLWYAGRSAGVRGGWLAAIAPAQVSADNCPPMLNDSAVAFVHLHRDLEKAVRRGRLSRVREDSQALARHLTPVDPLAAAAALHLAEAEDISTARERFERMERLLSDTARPRASDQPHPNVRVTPATAPPPRR